MEVYYSERMRHLRAIMKRIPEPIKGYLEERIFDLIFMRSLHNLKPKLILQGESRSRKLAFCIVHWNAPEFLLLNVNQLEVLHPESNVYILDNGSEASNLDAIKKGLKRFKNVTLFSARPKYSSHTVGLQFLLNYSARQLDEVAVFLDQDCLLSNNIDDLTLNLNNDILLIGARDYLVIPKDYGPLKKGNLRNQPNMVHPSFMMLKPKRIIQLFGNYPFFKKKIKNASWSFHVEVYHALSYRAQGHIMFLEMKMHDTIPLLTSYLHHGAIYAWHAWGGSRMLAIHRSDLPVSWAHARLQLAYKFMKQVHEATVTRRQNK